MKFTENSSFVFTSQPESNSVNDFRFHLESELCEGVEVEFIGLSGKIKNARLKKEKGKFWLPESGGVNAITVKLKLI